jgi:sugar lactone lactonase YvrE
MYVISEDSTRPIHQYSLSNAFDVSTASYDSVSFNLSSQDNQAQSISFNTDGTKMYMIGTATDTVHQYSLSTGFDLSTASYDSVGFNTSGQQGVAVSLVFSSDGKKMYVSGLTPYATFQYSTGL